ncbi:hypothetical protein [Methanolobus sp.]|jgi:hypothetical protein|uniref:hypothetical protein n=1 Tax=Methanolobus sp. TaxID=1874737 RepID=UPI0025DE59E0|nr:hypothetical protein [Methanolobus sp.]
MATVHVKKLNVLSLGKTVAIVSGILSFLLYTLFPLVIIPLLIENASRMRLFIGVAQTEIMVTIAMFILVPLIYGFFGGFRYPSFLII